jgi:hypothetical protein
LDSEDTDFDHSDDFFLLMRNLPFCGHFLGFFHVLPSWNQQTPVSNDFPDCLIANHTSFPHLDDVVNLWIYEKSTIRDDEISYEDADGYVDMIDDDVVDVNDDDGYLAFKAVVG